MKRFIVSQLRRVPSDPLKSHPMYSYLDPREPPQAHTIIRVDSVANLPGNILRLQREIVEGEKGLDMEFHRGFHIHVWVRHDIGMNPPMVRQYRASTGGGEEYFPLGLDAQWIDSPNGRLSEVLDLKNANLTLVRTFDISKVDPTTDNENLLDILNQLTVTEVR